MPVDTTLLSELSIYCMVRCDLFLWYPRPKKKLCVSMSRPYLKMIATLQIMCVVFRYFSLTLSPKRHHFIFKKYGGKSPSNLPIFFQVVSWNTFYYFRPYSCYGSWMVVWSLNSSSFSSAKTNLPHSSCMVLEKKQGEKRH